MHSMIISFYYSQKILVTLESLLFIIVLMFFFNIIVSLAYIEMKTLDDNIYIIWSTIDGG